MIDLNESELILKYKPLALKIAKRVHRKRAFYLSLDDVISAGMIGLWDAIRKYKTEADLNSEHDKTFEYYLNFRVYGSIIDEMRNQDWAHRRKSTRNKINATLYSMEEISKSDEDLYFRDSNSPEKLLADKELLQFLLASISSEEKRKVFIKHNCNEITAKNIAIEVGVSEARIFQINKEVKAELKQIYCDLH